MALPVLTTRPITTNARVSSFFVGNEETVRQNGRFALQRDRAGADELIEQAYRQIFFHAFKVDRDAVLESQLRSGQISTRDFIRALLKSDKFRTDFYRCNSNYRVVEQVVGRVLGRPVHGESERIAWSIVIAQKGLPGFIDALLDSAEYRDCFGDDLVPYQRSRVLAGQAVGTMPFNQQAPATTPTGVKPWPAAPPPVAAAPGHPAAAGPSPPGWPDSPAPLCRTPGAGSWPPVALCSPALWSGPPWPC